MKLNLSIKADAQSKKSFSSLLLGIFEEVKRKENPFTICQKTEKGFLYESVPGNDSYDFDLFREEGEIKIFINSYRGLMERFSRHFRVEIPSGIPTCEMEGRETRFFFKKEEEETGFVGVIESAEST